MEERAAALLDVVQGGGQLSMRQTRQVGGVVSWLHAQDRGGELQVIRDAVFTGALTPLSRDWFVLCCLFYSDAGLSERLKVAWRSWGPRSQERLSKRLGGLQPDRLAALPDVLATRVVREGVRLDDVARALQLPSGCELEAQVWHRLLSPAGGRWMLSQPRQVVDEYLGRRTGHWSVGAIGRQILEPAAHAGATPEDVAPGAPMAAVVEMVARRLPARQSHKAWELLGDGARDLVRWWQTQRDLEKFFREWNADPEREFFWRAYVKHIRGIEAYKSASVLAMKVGQFWFVEFGEVGNASYAYRDEDWQRGAVQRRRAWRAADFKRLPMDQRRRMTHREGWQPRFEDWIRKWTGLRPAGRIW